MERSMSTKAPNPDDEPTAKKPEPRPGGRFVETMLSGFGHGAAPRRAAPHAAEAEPYRPLPQSKAPASAMFRLPHREPGSHVRADSPAAVVMTDLTRVNAVTVAPGASVEEANRLMIRQAVRSLFVVDEAGTVRGIVTATDVLGERPVQVAQDHGMRHVEVLVQQVMTPADMLEAIALKDVAQARVGDIVETLKRSGRQHALVIEADASGATTTAPMVRGIFSLTQIARQLGLPPQVGHGIARTFAEIEAEISR
jgi:hypothetical protein